MLAYFIAIGSVLLGWLLSGLPEGIESALQALENSNYLNAESLIRISVALIIAVMAIMAGTAIAHKAKANVQVVRLMSMSGVMIILAYAGQWLGLVAAKWLPAYQGWCAQNAELLVVLSKLGSVLVFAGVSFLLGELVRFAISKILRKKSK